MVSCVSTWMVRSASGAAPAEQSERPRRSGSGVRAARQRARTRTRVNAPASSLWLSSASGRPLLQRLQRQAVVARKHVCDLDADARSTSSWPISACRSDAAHHDAHSSRAVALPQRARPSGWRCARWRAPGWRRRRSSSTASSASSAARVGARHVEHDVAVKRTGAANSITRAGSASRRPGRSTRAPDEASRSTPDAIWTTRPAEERLVEAMGVLERVDHREPRLDAEKHRGIAAGLVQVDQQRLDRVATFRAPSRRSRPRVVVPTPPLAPTKREDLAGHRAAVALLGRRARSPLRDRSSVTGSATNSLTPARIASSISAGSSGAATRIDDGHGWMLALVDRDRRRELRLCREGRRPTVRLRASALASADSRPPGATVTACAAAQAVPRAHDPTTRRRATIGMHAYRTSG